MFRGQAPIVRKTVLKRHRRFELDGCRNHLSNPDIALEHFRAIVLSSGDAIISRTLDGVITRWNVGATRIFDRGRILHPRQDQGGRADGARVRVKSPGHRAAYLDARGAGNMRPLAGRGVEPAQGRRKRRRTANGQCGAQFRRHDAQPCGAVRRHHAAATESGKLSTLRADRPAEPHAAVRPAQSGDAGMSAERTVAGRRLPRSRRLQGDQGPPRARRGITASTRTIARRRPCRNRRSRPCCGHP